MPLACTWWRSTSCGSRRVQQLGRGDVFPVWLAPASVAALHHHVGGGVVWDGALRARPWDETGLAFSDGLLTQQSVFPYGFENEVELYYQFDAGHGLTVQPDVEFWAAVGRRIQF